MTGPRSPNFLTEIDENVCPSSPLLSHPHRRGEMTYFLTWPAASRGKPSQQLPTRPATRRSCSSNGVVNVNEGVASVRAPSVQAPRRAATPRCRRERRRTTASLNTPLDVPPSPPPSSRSGAATVSEVSDTREGRGEEEQEIAVFFSQLYPVADALHTPTHLDRELHTQIASALLPVRRDVYVHALSPLLSHMPAKVLPTLPVVLSDILGVRSGEDAIATEEACEVIKPSPASSWCSLASAASRDNVSVSPPPRAAQRSSPSPCPAADFSLPSALTSVWNTPQWQRVRGYTRFERAVQGSGQRWCVSPGGASVCVSANDASSCGETVDPSTPTPRESLWSPVKPPAHGHVWGEQQQQPQLSCSEERATVLVLEAAAMWAAEQMCAAPDECAA